MGHRPRAARTASRLPWAIILPRLQRSPGDARCSEVAKGRRQGGFRWNLLINSELTVVRNGKNPSFHGSQPCRRGGNPGFRRSGRVRRGKNLSWQRSSRVRRGKNLSWQRSRRVRNAGNSGFQHFCRVRNAKNSGWHQSWRVREGGNSGCQRQAGRADKLAPPFFISENERPHAPWLGSSRHQLHCQRVVAVRTFVFCLMLDVWLGHEHFDLRYALDQRL